VLEVEDRVKICASDSAFGGIVRVCEFYLLNYLLTKMHEVLQQRAITISSERVKTVLEIPGISFTVACPIADNNFQV